MPNDVRYSLTRLARRANNGVFSPPPLPGEQKGRHEVLKTKCRPVNFAINPLPVVLVDLNFLYFHSSMRLQTTLLRLGTELQIGKRSSGHYRFRQGFSKQGES
jgi:hypothetical protein